MKRRLYQYFFFLLLVILACGGADRFHPIKPDVKANSKTEIPTFSSSGSRKTVYSHQDKFGLPQRNSPQYSRDYPERHQILGELNDSESEQEDTSETSSELSKIARTDLWNAVFAFVNTFHTNKSAVHYAHSDHQDFPFDALYIQYRVFRL